MDKETLSNYGWIVVLVLILAVMMALASPFGSFVSTAIKDVTGGFWDVNSASLNAVGLDSGEVGFAAKCGIKGHYENDGKEPHGIPVENCTSNHTYTCECNIWTVPDGGKYYVGVTSRKVGNYTDATKVYNAGEQLPCGYVPTTGDTYVDKDYEYKFNHYYDFSSWYQNTQNSWSVRVLNTNQTKYGSIIESIAGKPITNMENTFSNCFYLENAPAIPSKVTTMESTFNSCYKLTLPPVIPQGVTNMRNTFGYCKALTTVPQIPNTVTTLSFTFDKCESLTKPPVIPNSVITMDYTFRECYNLKTAPIIPNSVTSLSCTFTRCKSLTTAPVIPSKVTNMYGTFDDCTSLTEAPIIPSSVTDLQNTFSGCTSLTIPPVIPNSVTDIEGTFSDCTSLSVAPVIPDHIKSMQFTFRDCTSLKIAPTIPSGVTNLSYTFSGCTSLTTVPTIPNTVTNMNYTFMDCTNLTGLVEINANPSSYYNCFLRVSFNKQGIILAGNSTMLNQLKATGNYYS